MVSKLSVCNTIAAVDAAARRWSDRSYAPRRSVCHAIVERIGYPAPVVETALDRLFAPLNAAVIEAAVVAELGSIEVLDGFVARADVGRVRALPIGRTCIVSSRTTIGVAVMPAIYALCAGCDVLVKDREDRLVAAFFETLCEVQPALRDRIAATSWNGEGDDVDLSSFDGVVAFGTRETLAAIARRLPLQARYIPHSAASSAGYVAAESLDDEVRARAIAHGAASDALLYDGEGCMSLHVLFVESGGPIAPAAFSEFLRDALVEAATRYPASTVPAAAARFALQRDDAMLQAVEWRVFSDERASYLLAAGSSNGSPPLLIPRTLNLVAVDNLRQAAEYLQRHHVTLEALAVAGAGTGYAEFAAACGIARITRIGSMQSPPPGSPHGGRPCIAEFVRWLTDET